jgi:hypothetical protein
MRLRPATRSICGEASSRGLGVVWLRQAIRCASALVSTGGSLKSGMERILTGWHGYLPKSIQQIWYRRCCLDPKPRLASIDPLFSTSRDLGSRGTPGSRWTTGLRHHVSRPSGHRSRIEENGTRRTQRIQQNTKGMFDGSNNKGGPTRKRMHY